MESHVSLTTGSSCLHCDHGWTDSNQHDWKLESLNLLIMRQALKLLKFSLIDDDQIKLHPEWIWSIYISDWTAETHCSRRTKPTEGSASAVCLANSQDCHSHRWNTSAAVVFQHGCLQSVYLSLFYPLKESWSLFQHTSGKRRHPGPDTSPKVCHRADTHRTTFTLIFTTTGNSKSSVHLPNVKCSLL